MNEIEIIRAEIKHVHKVYELICELENAQMDFKYFSEVFEHHISSPDVSCFAAMQDTVIIGFASVHIQSLLHHSAKIAELQELIVEKNHQGHGVGSLLFGKIKQTSSDAGCGQIEVCCNQKRLESHKFYLKHGMVNSHFKFTLPLSECS